MLLNMPKALLLGVCGVFLLLGLGQTWSVWWLQQQLQHQLSEQSQQLSRIILARTAEKFQHQFVVDYRQTPDSTAALDSTSVSPTPGGGQTADVTMIKLRRHEPAGSAAQAGAATATTMSHEDLTQQLEQTLTELRGQQGETPKQWVSQFRIKTSDSSKQLSSQYLSYQMIVLAVSTLLALAVMLGLAQRLLQPLQRLQQGFRALAAGQAGVQLDTGAPLQEYRVLLQQFNQTSQELAALQAQKAELARQQQLVELGEISRGLVHAMRNPIHTMALALDQLPDTAPQLKHLIEQKMQHLNRTLTSLLTLSCAAIDRQQRVNLRTVLQDLALEFYHAGLCFDCSDDVTIAGAESELRFIFHVLISNAVEASPQQGSVQIRLQQQADGCLLQVCDQGPGLASDISQQLFSPHVSSKADGAGMGLYLAKRLLELYYHAQLSLVNAPAGGCVASVTFRQETV